MRLVTYCVGPAGPARAGVRVGHRVLDIEAGSRVKGEPLPSTVKGLLAAGRGALSRVQALAKAATIEARSFSHAMHEENAVRLLPPVPDAERFHGAGDRPEQTGKPSNLVGQDGKVPCPRGAGRKACRPQLVFVIGRSAQGVRKDDAMDCVAGVSILNEFPGIGAMGPEIVTLDEIVDPFDLWMTFSLNGEVRMRASTRERVALLPDLIGQASRDRALEAGDLFALGPPEGQELFVAAGDGIECSIEGITTLRTAVVASGDD